jgi:Niemann-Pick C1 protein
MDDEKDIGSPFQINIPRHPPPEKIAFDPLPRNCFDADLGSRCACVDCPSTCPVLLYTFILILAYGLASAAFIAGYLIEGLIRHCREKTYERLALSGDAPPGNVSSPGSHSRTLIGATSLAQYLDGEASTGSLSESCHLG